MYAAAATLRSLPSISTPPTPTPFPRRRVLRVAPLITALQLSQFGMGTLVNGWAAWAYYLSPHGCAVHPHILYLGALMYIAYGGLFANLFLDRCARPTTFPCGTVPPCMGPGACLHPLHRSRCTAKPGMPMFREGKHRGEGRGGGQPRVRKHRRRSARLRLRALCVLVPVCAAREQAGDSKWNPPTPQNTPASPLRLRPLNRHKPAGGPASKLSQWLLRRYVRRPPKARCGARAVGGGGAGGGVWAGKRVGSSAEEASGDPLGFGGRGDALASIKLV